MLHNKTYPCSKPKQACPAALSSNSKRCTLNSQYVHISFTVTFIHYHRTKIKLAANNVVTKKTAYRGDKERTIYSCQLQTFNDKKVLLCRAYLSWIPPCQQEHLIFFFLNVSILLKFNADLNNYKALLSNFLCSFLYPWYKTSCWEPKAGFTFLHIENFLLLTPWEVMVKNKIKRTYNL